MVKFQKLMGHPLLILIKLLKANAANNGIMGVIYKAQLYLAPYSPKVYIEKLGQNLSNTNNVINVYFVPSDKINLV